MFIGLYKNFLNQLPWYHEQYFLFPLSVLTVLSTLATNYDY